MPTQGGGALGGPAQSPIQAPLATLGGGGAGAPAQAVQGAAQIAGANGGGVVQQAPASMATGGGPVDMSKIVPVLTQLVAALTQLVQTLTPIATAQAAASGVQGGGAIPQSGGGGGAADAAGAAHGCGMAGCTMGADGVAAGAAGAPEPIRAATTASDVTASVAASAAGVAPASMVTAATSAASLAGFQPVATAAASGGSDSLDGDLTVKRAKMSDAQRANLQQILRTAKQLGANEKVMVAAVATAITESSAKNDASVDSKDHDSLGLFQQRPQSGWGTREQISDPVYATEKFLHGISGHSGAIEVEAAHPDWAVTQIAQKVQVSAYPNAYAKHEAEAREIVADFLA